MKIKIKGIIDGLYGLCINDVLINDCLADLSSISESFKSNEEITIEYSEGITTIPNFRGTYQYEGNVELCPEVRHWFDLLKEKTTEIILPSSISDIEPFTFSGFKNLRIRGNKLPDKLLDIGDYAFSGCSELVLFDVNPLLKGNNAFERCKLISFSDGQIISNNI